MSSDEQAGYWSIYVWPKGHVEGEWFPEDFYEKLSKALHDAGIEWESQ